MKLARAALQRRSKSFALAGRRRILLLLGGACAAEVAAKLSGAVELQPSLLHLDRWLIERRASSQTKLE